MGYTPAYLRLTVEALGAEWDFSTPDAALAQVSDAYALLGAERAVLYVERDTTPPEILAAYCEVFKQGIVGWRGVNDPVTGRPLPCTPENIAAIPTEDKFEVAGAYLLKRQALREKKAESISLPTDSSPPATSADS